MIGSLQLFDMVWILTGGGPANATTTMATFLITEGTKRYNYGIATAASVILFAVALVLAAALPVLRPAPRRRQADAGSGGSDERGPCVDAPPPRAAGGRGAPHAQRPPAQPAAARRWSGSSP